MWFRRLFRRRGKPPSLDLSELDRVEELVARVIALLPGPTAALLLPEPAPIVPAVAQAHAAAHLLFLPGYELAESPGPAPDRGVRVEHGGRQYLVVRHGPSPLPGDLRRCVFLEQEQPSSPRSVRG